MYDKKVSFRLTQNEFEAIKNIIETINVDTITDYIRGAIYYYNKIHTLKCFNDVIKMLNEKEESYEHSTFYL